MANPNQPNLLDLWETAESGSWDSAYSKNYRQQDFKRERRWTKQFKCLVLSGGEDPDTTLTNCQASGAAYAFAYSAGLAQFPQQWDPHPADPDMVAQEFHVKVMGGEEGPNVRTVEVVYELAVNPLAEKPVIQWDSNSYQRVIPGAYPPSPLANPLPLTADGYVPLTNTAEDTFNPPPVWQEPYRVLKIVKNITHATWTSFENLFMAPNGVAPQGILCTNSIDFVVTLPSANTFVTYPAGTALMDTPPHGETQFRNSVDFVRSTFTFKCRWRGWRLPLLNAGFNKLGGAGLVLQPLFVGARPVVNPQLLGQPDANGDVNLLPVGSAPIYLQYVIYGTYDFNQFGLT